MALQLWFKWGQAIPQGSLFYKNPALPDSGYKQNATVSYRVDRASFDHALNHALRGETCLNEEAIILFRGRKHRRGVRKRKERFIKAWSSFLIEIKILKSDNGLVCGGGEHSLRIQADSYGEQFVEMQVPDEEDRFSQQRMIISMACSR
ncbi:hypothetical protein C0995_004445 [Termitomyces sp. Mi166|nr:hypothetical protein C0995_004445 [Termitomyces sp. Mi166\